MKMGIIAAGEGSRLRLEGIDTPKPLLPIRGIPMIERIIRAAIAFGLQDVVCVVNEQIAHRCGYLVERYNEGPVRFSLTVRTTPSSLHSFAAIAPQLRGNDFCLATTDTIFPQEEFHRYLAHASQYQTGDGLLAITRYIDDEKPLYASIDGEKKITRFGDTPGETEWVTGGLYFFSERVLDMIDPALEAGTQRLRNFLRLLLEHQFQLHGFPFSRIIDVDHVSDIDAAEDLLSDEQYTGVDP